MGLKDNDELDKLDLELSEYLVKITQKLRDLVNVRISVEIDKNRLLIFGKHSGEWALLIERDSKITPLLSCSREERVEIANNDYISNLIHAIPNHLSRMILERKNAIRKLDLILDKF